MNTTTKRQENRYADSEMLRQMKFIIARQEFDDAIERMYRAEVDRKKGQLLAKYGERNK